MDEKLVVKSWQDEVRARRQKIVKARDALLGHEQILEMRRTRLQQFDSCVFLAETALKAWGTVIVRDDLKAGKDTKDGLANHKWLWRSQPIPTTLELSDDSRRAIRGFRGLFAVIEAAGNYQEGCTWSDDDAPAVAETQRITDRVSLEFVLNTNELSDYTVASYSLIKVNDYRCYQDFLDHTLLNITPDFSGLDEFADNLQLLQRKRLPCELELAAPVDSGFSSADQSSLILPVPRSSSS